MTYEDKTRAEVIADTTWDGMRLTTMRVTFPRFILAEFNTHRAFCLAGDQQLEFDLPAGSHGGSGRRVHHMTIAEFVDKWEGGARREVANPKTEYDYSTVNPSAYYTADEMAARVGIVGSAINQACRQGKIQAHKSGRKWKFSGESFMSWRRSKPEHTRFDIRERLGQMQIRQINETTGDIQTSTVVGVSRSGLTEIYDVKAGDFTVSGSQNHRVLTEAGWKPIGQLTTDDFLVVRKFGKRHNEIMDPNRLRKIDGKWRSAWQRDTRRAMAIDDPNCRDCGDTKGTDVHHIESVHVNPARAFDTSNVTLLCVACHANRHRTQGWQGGTYLYGATAQVESVTYRGTEEAYDLEIAGEFPNFVANGVIVHNSRNSASSRAIPVKRQIELVKESPFIPQQWPKNQTGMSASENLENWEAEVPQAIWLMARDEAVRHAGGLSVAGVHKQIASRLLEPFMWHTVIVSSTEWENFFAQRDHEDAQPEMQTLAKAMRRALEESTPAYDVLHIPWDQDFITPEESMIRSVARCARVSYGRELEEKTYEEDKTLVTRLITSGHWSPFEHVGIAGVNWYGPRAHKGNFDYPWSQLRHHWREYLPSISSNAQE